MPTNYTPSQVYDKYVALQKQLATNITNKGVTASQTELYDNLIDKVAQIENLKGEERTLENFTNVLSERKSIVQLKYPEPKNLFDKNNANIIAGYIDANVITAATASRCIYIPCNPNTTYTVSKIATARFVVAFTNVIPTAGTAVTNRVQNYTATSITAKSGADSKYIVAWLYNGAYDTTTTIDEILATVQIEQGSTATSYEPYLAPKTLNAKLGSKNLFDETTIVNKTVGGLTMSTNSDGSHKLTGTLAGQIYGYFNKVNLSQTIPKGTTVTVSGWYDVTPTGNYIGLVGYAEGNKLLFQANTKASGEHLTTALTDDLVSVALVFRCAASAVGDTVTFDNIKLQLELGSIATPYTPYISDFSTVNVTRCEKNLFNQSLLTDWGLVLTDGKYVGSSSNFNGKTLASNFQNNTQYTISLKGYNTKSTEASILISVNYTDGTSATIIRLTATSETEYKFTTAAGKTVSSFKSTYYNADTVNISYIQIEQGSTVTAYEPYQGQTYTPTAFGEVTGITNLYPITTLLTDNAGVVFTKVLQGTQGIEFTEILPSTGKNSITKINQPIIDRSVDDNIKPENIKQGVNILGVTGDYICNYTYDETMKELVLIL